MTQENIKYGLIFKPSTTEILLKGSILSSTKKIEKESTKIVQKLIQKNLGPNQRQEIKSPKHGRWIASIDEQSVIHVFLVDNDYSERLGYRLVEESMKEIQTVPNYYAEPQHKVESQFYSTFRGLMLKYNVPEEIDMMAKVNVNVDKASAKIGDNITKALGNQQQFVVFLTFF